MVDTASSNVFKTMYACILVEIDTSKGLPEMIKLKLRHGPWIQLLHYECIPFQCRIYHKTSHLVARCSSEKSRSMKSPYWQKGVLDDHYTVQKASSVRNGASSQDTLATESTVISNGKIVPTVVTSSDHPLPNSISGDLTIAPPVASSLDIFAPSLDVVDPSFVVVRSLTAGVLGDGCGVPEFAWLKATSLVEDGWTTVKGKKVKPSTPFDMALRSPKVGPKGKA